MQENVGRRIMASNPLTAQELRRKRLAALSGETASTETSMKNFKDVAAAGSIEVVDLCDSPDAIQKAFSFASTKAIDSDTDDEETLLKGFYQEKKKRKKKSENEGPAKKKKAKSKPKKQTSRSSSLSPNKTAAPGRSSAASIKKASSSTLRASTSSSNEASVPFQVATWNVWFGAPNLPAGEPHASARMKALARHLLRAHDAENNPLWAIGFQEVIEELAVHLFPLLEKAGYQVFRQQGMHAYGCALAVYTNGNNSCTLLDAGWQPYQTTRMTRGFMYARIQLPFSGKQLLFSTTHLESWIGKHETGSNERQYQLKEMESFCNEQLQTYPSLQTAIITGDLNWDDERTPRQRTDPTDPVMANVLQTSWNDSWLTTRNDARETCFTYDAKSNPMLGGNLRRRFDRCLVRNTGGGSLEASSTQLVGKEALVSLTWQKLNPYKQTYKEMPTTPSDHFGLLVQLTT